MDPIYLDHNGTTPVEPDVLAAMLPFLRGEYGNPSSATPLGHRAKIAIEAARAQVARLIGASSDEITFTSGGTEASNQAIFGLASRLRTSRTKIVTSTVEHPATEVPCRRLTDQGFDVVYVPVERSGVVAVERFGREIGQSTALVTLIHAQNETGVLQPVREIAAIASRAGAPFHVDASQSVGKVPIDVESWGISALTIAGHKLYAPKGIGALYLRRGQEAPSLLAGAGQEHGRRPGTENVAFIVGLGCAAALAERRLHADAQRMGRLRETLWQRLSQAIPGLIRVGDATRVLPNTLNVLFPSTTGQALLAAAPQVAASTGSACHAGETKPSQIILSHGFPVDIAAGAVRLSVGRHSDETQMDAAASALIAAWGRLAGAQASA